MNKRQFDSYTPDLPDKFYSEKADIQLTGLKPKSDRKPLISILISTYNRQAQLSRSLECYARQKFRSFEILLNNDGSTQDIHQLVRTFEPFVNFQYFHSPRSTWTSCPSKAYAKMMPHAQGDIIVVAHPEMILTFDALQFIYDVLENNKLKNCSSYVIDTPNYEGKCDWKWVSLRPNFFDDTSYSQIDTVNWHKNPRNFHIIPGWNSVGGFANRPNIKHTFVPGYPWWFVGAARKDCPVWKDTPITVGHASIDMFWCYYRKKYKFLDVVPNKIMCYHQIHQTSAVAPENEMVNLFPPEEGAKCRYDW